MLISLSAGMTVVPLPHHFPAPASYLKLLSPLQVAYAWATTQTAKDGAVLLQRLGLLDEVINYAIETGAFAHAFQFADEGTPGRTAEVRLKYAMYLEDEGRFKEAEQEFVAAGARRLLSMGR